MKLWDCFITALHALFSNKLRSSLTMLGILIGVAAVISVMSLGKAQQAMVTESFESLGASLIYVMPGASSGEGPMPEAVGNIATLTLEDAEAIARDAPSVAAVAPLVETTAQIVAGRENVGTMVAGVTPERQWVNNLEIAQGSFITERDYEARSRVVVLGSELAETLFGRMDPTGQSIKINGRKFNVIGVLRSKGLMFGSKDLMAYAPLSTVQSTLAAQQVSGQGHSVQEISVQARSDDEIDSAKDEITNILRQRHRIREGDKDDFSVTSMGSLSRMADQVLGIVQLVLGAIAGISLVVGGIGIMNIMLVSVTERTREIGLRKAVGAKRSDILTQFLTESAMLSICGGIIGIGLGALVAKLASIVATNAGFPFAAMLSWDVVALAVGVSLFVGLASGVYPATRAARLNPIEALRHE